MKVPFSWLKEFVDIDVTAQELEEKLFSCGFEVEELIPLDAGIQQAGRLLWRKPCLCCKTGIIGACGT